MLNQEIARKVYTYIPFSFYILNKLINKEKHIKHVGKLIWLLKIWYQYMI